jgi:hypothetical protein
MPWQEVTRMSLRQEFVKLAMQAGANRRQTVPTLRDRTEDRLQVASTLRGRRQQRAGGSFAPAAASAFPRRCAAGRWPCVTARSATRCARSSSAIRPSPPSTSTTLSSINDRNPIGLLPNLPPIISRVRRLFAPPGACCLWLWFHLHPSFSGRPSLSEGG